MGAGGQNTVSVLHGPQLSAEWRGNYFMRRCSAVSCCYCSFSTYPSTYPQYYLLIVCVLSSSTYLRKKVRGGKNQLDFVCLGHENKIESSRVEGRYDT